MDIFNDSFFIAMISELREHGMQGDYNIEHFRYNIKVRHVDRYKQILAFAKKHSIPRTWDVIDTIYMADIVLRREISYVLKPLEIELMTRILYFLKRETSNNNSLWDFDIYLNPSEFHGNKLKVIQNNFEFMKSSVNKIVQLIQCKEYEFTKIFHEMSFSQLVTFSSLLKNEYKDFVFSTKNFDDEIKSYKMVVSLRNHIAHHNLVFANKAIRHEKAHFKINEFLDNMTLVGRKNVRNHIIETMQNYFTKKLIKYKDPNSKSLMENCFNKIIATLTENEV